MRINFCTIHVGGHVVYGFGLDSEGRCQHWHSDCDVVANRFGCCGAFYACHRCHEEANDHPMQPWQQSRFNEVAVLCCVCGHGMKPLEYFDCGSACPSCHHAFNTGCQLHREIYFEVS